MKILADMHVHSTFSLDGKDDLDKMCRDAIQKGVNYICFTEHFDCSPQDLSYGYFQIKEFRKAIDQARRNYGDQLVILKGIEFGEPHLFPKELEEMNRCDFDVILGSIHSVGPYFVGDEAFQVKYSIQEIFEQYYRQVLKMVKVGGFDVLAHFDFPKRYLKATCDHPELIVEILGEIVKAGIALEINTSPLRKGFNESAPDILNIKRYLKAGGSKLTSGSDAHSGPDIAADFDYAVKRVTEAGGGQIGIFEQRKFRAITGQLMVEML